MLLPQHAKTVRAGDPCARREQLRAGLRRKEFFLRSYGTTPQLSARFARVKQGTQVVPWTCHGPRSMND
jgi:hypothetical protein